MMHWPDYSLLDCGGQEKLERFGPYVLRRPEPQAIWSKQAEASIWHRYDASFTRSNQEKAGGWTFTKAPIQPWWIHYQKVKLQLQCTSFGHVGVFPEQIENWAKLDQLIQKLTQPKVLNLFAYTGAASLVARQSGAEVYHVDAVPSMLTWARTNMEQSDLSDIRWVAEDAFKFVSREVNRSKSYDGIILDPPAYGRGPKGEKWLLADQIDELLDKCTQLLKPAGKFILLNMYSMGFSPMIAQQLLELHFKGWHIEAKELYITAESGVVLPLGIYGLAVRNSAK
ncbi:MAG: class I SAM-dependent methyltransferase [Saprospiraceae bacterium]|nr:class I SAM-dependent methyltransferase [Saprospiraceae bacterium]